MTRFDPAQLRYLDEIAAGRRRWRRIPAREIKPGDVVVYTIGTGCTPPVVHVGTRIGGGDVALELADGGYYYIPPHHTPLVGREGPEM